MRMTFTLCEASARKRRSAVPGTPTMLMPRSVRRVISSTEVIPFATPSPLCGRFAIRLPGAAGFIVFLMRIGIPFATAGAIVAEWSTFAPKYESSIASSYEMFGTTKAEGTARGSALKTPSTSVQISMTVAPSAEPKIAAE